VFQERGSKRAGAHQGLETEAAQHLHGIAADLDAGAEPGEFDAARKR